MAEMSAPAKRLRIFISHSHQDSAFCRQLVQALRAADADVWYDEHNLHAGSLLDSIEQELRTRPVFLLILSPAALKSQWVRNECKWAFTRMMHEPQRLLLPVLAAPVREEDIWLWLQDFKRIEAPGVEPYPPDEAVRQTLHALSLSLPDEAPISAAPQPEETAEDLLNRGRALRAQGDYAEALTLFARARQLEPGNMVAWANYGNLLMDELKQAEEALPVF